MTRPKREGVMLAYPGDTGRISRLGDRVFAQPKLKGERCRVEWFKGDPRYHLMESFMITADLLMVRMEFILSAPEGLILTQIIKQFSFTSLISSGNTKASGLGLTSSMNSRKINFLMELHWSWSLPQ